MAGGTGDDGQDGGAGNDTIYANRGARRPRGGDGNDALWALARADVSRPRRRVDTAGDTLDGGNGDDTSSAPATARPTRSPAAPATTARCSTPST